ncbi:cell division protein ZipA [Alcanivorax sp.]|uniref:cell division protein ZipA n=1 Tax=Alcanivorax sp. TaxID=1872427 RepID=UPI000C50E52E|nr:cell division protein ZipA [Alcanivorax sp.]MBQ25108.1 cell division protein ZipA [Alcanivorax sp.]
MGLNLETLIGILVILILLILADGMRRMIRERHGRLRMRIDPRYRDQAEEEENSSYNPELIGSARVIRRAMEDAEQDERPPMVMEPDEAAAEARTAEQQSLFDGEQEPEPQPERVVEPDVEPAPAPAQPVAEKPPEPKPEPEPAPRVPPRQEPRQETRVETRPAPKAPREPQPVLEVIVVHLIAHRGAPFEGSALLRMLLEAGLRYGRMNIFHRHVSVQDADELQFSMANAVEPGTFDLDTMEDKTFAGVTFFLKLPGPTDAIGALDKMLSICQRLAAELDGELKDEQHSVLTPQTMEHLRQRVQEFERRQRVPSA